MNNISDYIVKNTKIKFCVGKTEMYRRELGKFSIVKKYRYVQSIKTKYIRPVDLYCANICISNTETVYGDLYDYRKCFDKLYKANYKILTDGLIYNLLYNCYSIIKLPKLSYDEAKALIEHHIQRINEFNAYYDEVQLINKVEAL